MKRQLDMVDEEEEEVMLVREHCYSTVSLLSLRLCIPGGAHRYFLRLF